MPEERALHSGHPSGVRLGLVPPYPLLSTGQLLTEALAHQAEGSTEAAARRRARAEIAGHEATKSALIRRPTLSAQVNARGTSVISGGRPWRCTPPIWTRPLGGRCGRSAAPNGMRVRIGHMHRQGPPQHPGCGVECRGESLRRARISRAQGVSPRRPASEVGDLAFVWLPDRGVPRGNRVMATGHSVDARFPSCRAAGRHR